MQRGARWLLVLALALAPLVAGAAAAYALDGPPGPGGRPVMGGPGMMGGPGGGALAPLGPTDRPWLTIMLRHRKELGLSAEQVGKLYELREGFAETARAKLAEIDRAEAETARLLGPGPADLAAVEQRLRRVEALRTELRLARLRTIEQGKQLLTEAQRAQLGRVGPAPTADAEEPEEQ